MEEKNSTLLLILAWLNYVVSFLFSTAFLTKFALILSIIGSLFYIYNQIKNLKNKKNDTKTFK
jgi:uncharacterized membrane protein YciS (DUF1049 family)